MTVDCQWCDIIKTPRPPPPPKKNPQHHPICNISSTIAAPGELFSSDFRACARSPRWATRCSFGSVSCSCNAAPRSAVLNRALPVASYLRASSEECGWFFEADRNISSKSLASDFQSKKRIFEVVGGGGGGGRIVEKEKKKQNKKNRSIDLRRAFTSTFVDLSSITSASVAAGLFPSLSCFGFFNL